MTDNYALNQGLSLLEGIIKEFGPLFSFQQAFQTGNEQNLSRQVIRNILSKLTQSGWLVRLKRGLYTIQSPLYPDEIHPFAIAQALVRPIAISHWSALAHHGFTTQIPPMIQASTPSKVVTPEMRSGEAYRPRGTAAWRVMNIEIEYIHVKEENFWGFTHEWVSSWHRVAITDPERTLFDLVARSDLFGGISMAIETISSNLDKIDLHQLVRYAIRYDVGAYIKRLGWVLETNGVDNDILEPLMVYETQNYHLLDPQGQDEGEPITRWKLKNNLPGGPHD
jgi:predicted transcriptional regulator of viral defense system